MAEQKLPNKAQENEMKREKVRVVPIKYIDDSPDHPFQVRDDEEMMSLVESIATFGVITPVIARKTADERYELISGHRRKRGSDRVFQEKRDRRREDFKTKRAVWQMGSTACRKSLAYIHRHRHQRQTSDTRVAAWKIYLHRRVGHMVRAMPWRTASSEKA